MGKFWESGKSALPESAPSPPGAAQRPPSEGATALFVKKHFDLLFLSFVKKVFALSVKIGFRLRTKRRFTAVRSREPWSTTSKALNP